MYSAQGEFTCGAPSNHDDTVEHFVSPCSQSVLQRCYASWNSRNPKPTSQATVPLSTLSNCGTCNGKCYPGPNLNLTKYPWCGNKEFQKYLQG